MKKTIQLIPNDLCPLGKVIFTGLTLANPISWFIIPFYIHNFKKLKNFKELQTENDQKNYNKLYEKSSYLLIALSVSNTIFNLASSFTAVYCTAKYFVGAQKTTSIYAGLIAVGIVLILALMKGTERVLDMKKTHDTDDKKLQERNARLQERNAKLQEIINKNNAHQEYIKKNNAKLQEMSNKNNAELQEMSNELNAELQKIINKNNAHQEYIKKNNAKLQEMIKANNTLIQQPHTPQNHTSPEKEDDKTVENNPQTMTTAQDIPHTKSQTNYLKYCRLFFMQFSLIGLASTPAFVLGAAITSVSTCIYPETPELIGIGHCHT